ncbi:MAG: pyridoxamine 5'-phosphate oxidase family protein [Mobilitalea sp.]
MRRKDREISDINDILEIMKKCDVCRLAFHAGKYHYIIPMNFGVTYREGIAKLYFHGAKAGTKLELMKKNANVAFEMDCSHNLILGEIACESTMEYESVCGNGIMRIMGEDEKVAALSALMQQYQPDKKHEFSENEMKAVEVFELTVNEIHGKRLKK